MGSRQSRPQNYNYNTPYQYPPSIPPSSTYSYSASYVEPDTSGLQSRYSRIGDDYSSLEQVREALYHAGLESSNLIVGIDFTKSNEWTGAVSFNRKSLHHLGDSLNPYQQAISIIGRTLSTFDEDNLIPCYGFGDATTHDKDVFSFFPDDRPCNGFEEVLSRYRELVPQIRLAGPTSFAPIIETAIEIVDNSGGQYHVLMIIADGQVTRSVDTHYSQLSTHEQSTIDAIVKASNYPLSIVLVGVGDGPWNMMQQFDDNIPARSFDNFQFVNFTDIMGRNTSIPKKEADFALAALMEIPSQYKATLELHLLGCRSGTPGRTPLPPPGRIYPVVNSYTPYQDSSSFEQSIGYASASAPAPPDNFSYNKNCAVCFSGIKELVFGCGHQACCECGNKLLFCPVCRAYITTRIKLYD